MAKNREVKVTLKAEVDEYIAAMERAEAATKRVTAAAIELRDAIKDLHRFNVKEPVVYNIKFSEPSAPEAFMGVNAPL